LSTSGAGQTTHALVAIELLVDEKG